MRRTLIAATATLALLSGAAIAQTTSPSNPGASTPSMSNTAAPDSAVTTDPVTANGLTNGKMASADALIGKNVYGRDNDKLGEVDDVILDTNGQAKQLVIGSGGFLGIGEKKVAVEYNAANWDSANNRINLSGLSRDDVKAMPEFKYDDSMTSFNRTRTPQAPSNSTTIAK